MRPDGTVFSDKDVHKVLEKRGFRHYADKDDEWFACSVEDVRSAILEVKEGVITDSIRIENFKMRPEQIKGVNRTLDYYKKSKNEEPKSAPKFLWNCKMRYGKTFASYQLAKAAGFKRILILTFKPAVESSWRENLETHLNFKDWQFVSNYDSYGKRVNISDEFDKVDKDKPIVVFGSFQDLLGLNENGGIKSKNAFIHSINWDLVIFDEYHFGAWRDNAKDLFEEFNEEKSIDFDSEKYQSEEAGNAYNESFLPITTNHYLFLSGTPFRALNTGEFIEEQIYNWTYAQEQQAKANYVGEDNPYASMPKMVLMTYKIPDSIKKIAEKGEFNEFDLNVFFSAEGKGKNAHFIYEEEVQKWLDLIRGAYLPSKEESLKLGKNVPMPYSDTNLLNVLTHTLWFLPNVAACQAMENLLRKRQNDWFNQNYKIIVAAGPNAGTGVKALEPVREAMEDPLKTKTITLSCGKLTTGVTIKPWSGVFMLRNLKSPETYFQTAFRVQSPWEITDEYGKKHILKENCYVFDFALDRALRQISEYSCSLNTSSQSPEEKVSEFLSFLPVLAYDGSQMISVNAEDVLDFVTAGTSATLLARRWESALLVNVDNITLTRLMNNNKALEALMGIEGFRNLNQDIETIINRSENIQQVKKEGVSSQKKEISDEEKQLKSLRRQVQEKLIKFITRIPIFMYLTDYREKTLQDIIMRLEPDLFKKVTGLNVKDFELLCNLGLFNADLLNDAIFKFKRYEDASLIYTGIDRHGNSEEVGGWNIILKREEYEKRYKEHELSVSSDQMLSSVNPLTENPKEKSSKKELSNSLPDEQNTLVEKNMVGNIHNNENDAKLNLEYIINNTHNGSKVKHQKFGEGIINKVNKKYVYVQFSQGKKQFVYPDAFLNNFLELCKS